MLRNLFVISFATFSVFPGEVEVFAAALPYRTESSISMKVSFMKRFFEIGFRKQSPLKLINNITTRLGLEFYLRRNGFKMRSS